MTDKWFKLEDKGEKVHEMWENQETGERLAVEEFEDGTWDIFHRDLVENFDTPQEAVERAKEVMDKRP